MKHLISLLAFSFLIGCDGGKTVWKGNRAETLPFRESRTWKLLARIGKDNSKSVMTEKFLHNPSKPDKSKPWCPNCKLHTGYYSKSPDSAFYTCEICGGKTWKPTSPIPLLIVSVLIVFFTFFMGYFALTVMNDTRGYFVFSVGLYFGYMFYQNYASNAKHWRSFRKWAKENRQ